MSDTSSLIFKGPIMRSRWMRGDLVTFKTIEGGKFFGWLTKVITDKYVMPLYFNALHQQ